jgi:hypothetical protein
MQQENVVSVHYNNIKTKRLGDSIYKHVKVIHIKKLRSVSDEEGCYVQ